MYVYIFGHRSVTHCISSVIAFVLHVKLWAYCATKNIMSQGLAAMSIGEDIVGENSKTNFRNSKTEFHLPVAPVCNKTFSDFDV